MHNSTFTLALFSIPPLIIAVVLHEVAHGWMARRLGDPTADSLGRISLNPLVHIDPFMTVLLPAILIFSNSPVIFGGAKPVPCNPSNFKNPKTDMIWVALAGPSINIILAIICSLGISLFSPMLSNSSKPSLIALLLVNWLVFGTIINVVLAIFNLIPIPPLDGGRIAVGILPKPWDYKVSSLEPYGIFIVIFLLMTGVLNDIIMPIIELTMKLISPGMSSPTEGY